MRPEHFQEKTQEVLTLVENETWCEVKAVSPSPVTLVDCWPLSRVCSLGVNTEVLGSSERPRGRLSGSNYSPSPEVNGEPCGHREGPAQCSGDTESCLEGRESEESQCWWAVPGPMLSGALAVMLSHGELIVAGSFHSWSIQYLLMVCSQYAQHTELTK